MSDVDMIERARNNAVLLRKVNIVTLCVAIVVYVGLLGIATYNRLVPLAVFSSCIMVAEVLVFQIVRTLLDHLAVIRSGATRT